MTDAMNTSDTDVRDAFFDTICGIGMEDESVIVLSDDMDAFGVRRFKKERPRQFMNADVAEQNMVNISAGLALSGKRVFMFGIAPFVTMRCFEQIRVNLCSMNLPVTVIGMGAGFSFSFDGPTHHGVHDLALMRTLPEITIFNPSDAPCTAACARLAYASHSPVYVRLDKGKFPDLADGTGDEDFTEGFRVVRPLRDVNIVATGFMTSRAVEVARVLGECGIDVGVVDLYRVKPIGQAFSSAIVSVSKHILAIEETSVLGGVGTAVSELAAESAGHVRVTRFGAADRQSLEYGSREWFHQENGLDADSLVDSITRAVTSDSIG